MVDTVLASWNFQFWYVVHCSYKRNEFWEKIKYVSEKSDTLRNETYVEPDPYDYIV
jgi:hypothetical protein